MKKIFAIFAFLSFSLCAQETKGDTIFSQKQATAIKFLANQIQKCAKIRVPGEDGFFYDKDCIIMQSDSIYQVTSAFLPEAYSFPISVELKDLNECRVFVEKRIIIGKGIENIYAYKTGCVNDISYNIQRIIDGTY
jgi:hypothetical protein